MSSDRTELAVSDDNQKILAKTNNCSFSMQVIFIILQSFAIPLHPFKFQ